MCKKRYANSGPLSEHYITFLRKFLEKLIMGKVGDNEDYREMLSDMAGPTALCFFLQA